MAVTNALEGSNIARHPHLKSIRLIELSDHIIRLNHRENTQLDLRLKQLERRERIIRTNYDREIYLRRLQLFQIYKSLNEPSEVTNRLSRTQTPISFHAIKMRRYQSAPANRTREDTENRTDGRPKTTSDIFRTNKRAMNVFREITLKPELESLDNMLVLADYERKSLNYQWTNRSKTMVNLKED
ncbi:hypothetical protein I4U23_000678 [Adineta vaga]|nr:hypothetical protein I4U23_000678 [Adineta vaga]